MTFLPRRYQREEAWQAITKHLFTPQGSSPYSTTLTIKCIILTLSTTSCILHFKICNAGRLFHLPSLPPEPAASAPPHDHRFCFCSSCWLRSRDRRIMASKRSWLYWYKKQKPNLNQFFGSFFLPSSETMLKTHSSPVAPRKRVTGACLQ